MPKIITLISWVMSIIGIILIIPNFLFEVNNHLEVIGYFLIFTGLTGGVFADSLENKMKNF